MSHALCAAIREMLRVRSLSASSPRQSRIDPLPLEKQDYLILLAQLEEQFNSSSSFTLQRFWLSVHPALNTLSLIHSLTTDIVALSLPPLDNGSSFSSRSNSSAHSDSDDDLPGGGGEGMAGILAEMKAASAATRPADPSAGWRAGPAKGGEILHVLFAKLERTSGDPAAKTLYETLLLRASQPYARILLGWISTGELNDQWDEFIVKEGKGINQGSLDLDYTDDYWERRYTLRDRSSSSSSPSTSTSSSSSAAAAGKLSARRRPTEPRERGLAGGAVVPAFLDAWKDKILLAGKYLNVIRECGIEIEVPEGNRMGEGEVVRMDEERCVVVFPFSFCSTPVPRDGADFCWYRTCAQLLQAHRHGLYVREQDAAQAVARRGASRFPSRVRRLFVFPRG